MTGMTYDLTKDVAKSGADRTPINLKVSDMDSATAVTWMCRLAQLQKKDDPGDKSRILIGK
jgi:hypothetical protein